MAGWHRSAIWILSAAALLAACPLLPAQAPPDAASEIQELRTELKRIESRLAALEAAQSAAPNTAQPAPSVSAASAPAQASPPVPATGPEAVKQAADAGMDTMDAGMGGETIKIPIIPALKIRGFGDVRGFIANQNLAIIANTPGSPVAPGQAGRSTFALGLMDLFVTSQVSDHFSYLAEIGFEADQATNGVGVDLERAQLSYMAGDKFSFSAGRTHAMLGYYNTAFHHGTWFQTAIDRPHIFEFEDSGGPLPIHNVGLSAMGKVPSGKLGMRWFAEVGNGKQTYSLGATVTPANVLADHSGKSTNLGLLMRPTGIPGLQAGFNWYQAALVPVLNLLPAYGMAGFPYPDAVSNYHQNIYVGHVVYITPTFELMAEDAEIRDLPRGSKQPLYTSGGYGQISRLFKGAYRPYLRYQWLNPNFRDPNDAWVGRWVGPNAGLRWDINTYVALKAEYSRYDWKNFSQDDSGNQVLPVLHKTINQFGTQLTYTF